MVNSSSGGSFLGIECGGTRSVALLSQGGTAPTLRAEFGPANLQLLSNGEVLEHFTRIKEFQAKAGAPLAGIAIGMAGTRTESDRQRVRTAAAKVWPGVRCHATSDLETALAAGESGRGAKPEARILMLSGTGSCCFGQKADGTTLRYGGWGHVLGDKGSGYDIGLQGLKASVHFLDKEGRWPLLGRNILQTLQLNEPEDLIDWSRTAGKSEIAALGVQVFAAVAKGDKVARGILAATAETLANDGVNCARRLVKAGSPVVFIFAGSVLLKQPGFARHIKSILLRLWPQARVTVLRRESVCGALQLAQEHFGGDSTVRLQKIQSEKAPEPAADIVPVSSGLSPTEQRNPRSENLDRMPMVKAVTLMIEEESGVGRCLLKEKKKIARAIGMIVTAFKRGGRLFYIGAGTSGRLGVLDAVECPPTFRIPPERVQGIMAGGPPAIWRSVEGAEDDPAAGAVAINCRRVNQRDVVIGIAASGRTPFVWGGLAAARKNGAKTILVCFNPNIAIASGNKPDLVIAVDVGPEVLTGSTRLKAGTATKVILNTMTTLAMVRMGKVLSNLMMDLNASNQKLRERAVRIVQAVTGVDAMAAQAALEKSRWIVKTACQRLR
jgi:N-acetylmuramic acid 6-phosphate etherase